MSSLLVGWVEIGCNVCGAAGLLGFQGPAFGCASGFLFSYVLYHCQLLSLSLHSMSWEKFLPLRVFACCFAVGILLVVSIRVGTHRSADISWLTQVWCTTWPAVRTFISNLPLFGHLRGVCCLIDDGMSLADAALPSASGSREIIAARRDEALAQQHLPHFEESTIA